jgi:predicted lipoprotein with Yx(FWY)xxD motif
MKVMRVLAGLLVVIVALVILRGQNSARPTDAVPDFAVPAMPPGITLEPSVRGRTLEAGRAPEFTPGYFADANGLTLYSVDRDSDAGKPSCTGTCAAAWPPLAAPADAGPFGDWSIVARDDGSKQWAYKGHPLYRSTRDSKPGETNGNGIDSAWHTVFLSGAPDEIASPAGVTVQRLANADGEVFVDQNGLTLYISDADAAAGKPVCDGACIRVWKPLPAGELAKPVGDWSIATRQDGTRQWAYRGRPLYAFSGDRKAGDANGQYADKGWHPATLRRYFMPAQVTTRINQGWPVFATADGRTLYARDAFRFSFGGYSVHDGPPPVAATGREIGPGGCTGDCARSWIPLAAPADAKPSAFWSIVTRDDGTRQWAYQGYPLYSFAKDAKPGDMIGRDQFDLTDGSHALYWRLASP